MEIVTNGNGTAKDPITSAVLHRSLHEYPPKVVHTDGLYLHLDNGQRILDATGGPAVACLGHNHAGVKAAMIEQMDKVIYCHSMAFSTDAVEGLCRTLIEGTGGKMARVFVVSSGSEANEAALKMSRQYFVELEGKGTRRRRFIARKQSYHGTTMGALALSGHVARREIFEPMLSAEVSHVSPCYAYRGLEEGETIEQYVERLASELDQEFQRVGPDTVCAFIAEPVVGNALGCVPAVPGYFKAVRRVCDKHGALLILDEIMSGMGRSGYLHAWQSPTVDVVPDLQVIGKGLASGYAAVAAMLVAPKVEKVLFGGTGAFAHGQTYQSHPLSCATAYAVQNIIKEQSLIQRSHDRGVLLESLLKEQLSDEPFVGDVRGMGLFWGIEFVKDKKTKEPFSPEHRIALNISNLGLSAPHLISLYPGSGTADGVRGDHVIIAPPFTCTEEDIRLIVDKTAALIRAFFKANDFSSETSVNGNGLAAGGGY